MATCPRCRQAIRWELRGGKNRALNVDGSNHWATCKPATRLYDGPLTVKGKTITGEHYRPACGRCDEAPWNTCACSALLPAVDAMPAHSGCAAIAEQMNADADARFRLAIMEAI